LGASSCQHILYTDVGIFLSHYSSSMSSTKPIKHKIKSLNELSIGKNSLTHHMYPVLGLLSSTAEQPGFLDYQ
jgi:hypothetical protein